MLSCSVAVFGGVWCAIVPNPLIIATSQDCCSYSELFDHRKIVPRSVRSTSPATVFGSLRLDGCSFRRRHHRVHSSTASSVLFSRRRTSSLSSFLRDLRLHFIVRFDYDFFCQFHNRALSFHLENSFVFDLVEFFSLDSIYFHRTFFSLNFCLLTFECYDNDNE